MSFVSGVTRLQAPDRYDAATEQALIDQCKRQDYQAFAKIVDAYQARINGFVRRMIRNEEEALDVTQEVFIKAFQAMHRFDGRSSLRTWLFKIAYNLCVDRARKDNRAPAMLSMEPNTEGEETVEVSDARWNPETVVINEELYAIVEMAIGSMSEKLRTVLLLHDKEDLGYEEIATAVQVPVGTVKSRLFLARAHVQKVVAEYMNGGIA